MKSPMVETAAYIQDQGHYSDLKVLRSAAGWYVGTIYTDANGFPMPGSRDSGYFAEREEAEGFPQSDHVPGGRHGAAGPPGTPVAPSERIAAMRANTLALDVSFDNTSSTTGVVRIGAGIAKMVRPVLLSYAADELACGCSTTRRARSRRTRRPAAPAPRDSCRSPRNGSRSSSRPAGASDAARSHAAHLEPRSRLRRRRHPQHPGRGIL